MLNRIQLPVILIGWTVLTLIAPSKGRAQIHLVKNAKAVTLTQGDAKVISGQTSINIEFNFDHVGVGKYPDEKEYLAKKKPDYVTAWYQDRKNRHEPKFVESFCKDSRLSANPNATYTLIFATTYIEPGYNVGVRSSQGYISATADIIETANRAHKLASFSLTKVYGAYNEFKDYGADNAYRVEIAYIEAGHQLAKYLEYENPGLKNNADPVTVQAARQGDPNSPPQNANQQTVSAPPSVKQPPPPPNHTTGGRFSIGFEMGLPIGDFATTSNAGFGGSARYEHSMAKGLNWMVTAGYLSFSGKPLSVPFGPAPSTTTSLIPIQVGLKYYFTDNFNGFYLGAAAGVSASSTSVSASIVPGTTATTTDTAIAGMAGYHLKTFDFGLALQLIGDARYANLRVAFVIPHAGKNTVAK